MTMFVFFAILCVGARRTVGSESRWIRDEDAQGLTGNNTDAIAGNSKWSNHWNLSALEEEGDSYEDEVSAKSRLIKRQIIKIPSTVKKVKVISGETLPQPRPKRVPPARSVRGGSQQRMRPQTPYVQRPPLDHEDASDHSKFRKVHDSEERKAKKGYKKQQVFYKEVTPEEFYSDVEDFQNFPFATAESHQSPGKHANRHHKRKVHKHIHYLDGGAEDLDGIHSPQRSAKWSSFDPDSKNSDAGFEKPYEHEYSRPVKYSRQEPASGLIHDDSQHGTDEEYGDFEASTIHMKQVPAPDLAGMNMIDPLGPRKAAVGKESALPEMYSKQVSHSVFRQQYTSHNPQVVTNFGLDADGKTATYSSNQQYPRSEPKSFDAFGSHSMQLNGQIKTGTGPFASHASVTGSGLQVVQAPQLGTIKENVPRLAGDQGENQRATIRDILKQDCPQHDVLGYCPSPPRYPTVQIADMITKCSDLMELMYPSVPPEPEDDLSSFSRRSDEEDVIFDDGVNRNDTAEFYGFHQTSWSSWMRSGSDSESVCASQYTIIEPGYAREVTSGRWFVIVQNSDSSLQKVTTDTCLSPGEPCSGLAGMKCSRSRGFYTGIKMTRCIQRYTHQRLVSWDPEAPSKCPQIRVFRFPTACVCRLRLM